MKNLLMKFVGAVVFTLSVVTTNAQILDPVSWKSEIVHVEGDEYEIVYTATIDLGWYVYSQYLENEDGPIATSITYDEGSHFELIGKSTEDDKNKKDGFDPIFEMNVVKYKDEFVIRQRLKILDPSKSVSGYLEYMTCNDEKCLPPAEEEFSLKAPKTQSDSEEATTTETEGSDEVVNEEETESAEEVETPTLSADEKSQIESNLYGFASNDMTQLDSSCSPEESAEEAASKGYLSIFLLGFLGGFLALLTPCVFPMIPLTVSFFTKSSEGKKGMKNAFLYGFFIAMVYVILSIPFHLLDSLDPDILNQISTNVWLNIGFFAIFMFFAFSFFGYYELTLPSSLTNKVSSAESVGGVVGIFFMALTLALVSFSCTGPILGSLLAGAITADGGAWQLTAGMTGFGVALALPFVVFAMFPQMMNKIPKSGGWLNTVKVTFGFIELAMAMKFLSNADLVANWEIITYEIFIGFWLLVALGLGLYLFGVIRFKNDYKGQPISVGRKVLGIISIAFAVYLGTGFSTQEFEGGKKTFSSPTLLSGFPPPAGYSWIFPNDCPANINCFKDLNEGMAYAQKVGKPIMIDFTGKACVNCRKMEEQVWPDIEIKNILNDDYVLISLYVDYSDPLPESEQIEVLKPNGKKRKLKTVGNKWSHFQTEYFNTNSQPYYVLMSPDGKTVLNAPVGYTPDESEYKQFLNCGLDNFKKLSSNNPQWNVQTAELK